MKKFSWIGSSIKTKRGVVKEIYGNAEKLAAFLVIMSNCHDIQNAAIQC